MTRPRRGRKRSGRTSELIEAILSAEPLAFTPERWIALVSWQWLSDPPAGHERLKRPFDIQAQLAAWSEEREEYERGRRSGGVKR